MSDNRLQPSTHVAAADWLRPRLRPFGSAVAAVVPDGFPAYVRILHPAQGPRGEHVRWATVAAQCGSTIHALAQFHALIRPQTMPAPAHALWHGGEPPTGNLPAEHLRRLCGMVARHTSTPDSCWFCLWDGYGWLHGSPGVKSVASRDDGRGVLPPPPIPPAFNAEVLQGPRVHLPERDYLLFHGALEAASDLAAPSAGAFFPQSPNLFWPHDQAWCVASEIDLMCTLVAGSAALAAALVADPELEAWRIDPGDSIAYDGDQINTRDR